MAMAWCGLALMADGSDGVVLVARTTAMARAWS
jgi:phosphatidylserine synthase